MTETILPQGFRFAGVACGIKPSGKPDLSLIVGEHDLTATGVYTQNQIVAAPVVVCRGRTPSASIRAIVTNSGNANACTGPQGDSDALEMCRLAGQATGCDPDSVLVMSTGIIGQALPMDRVAKGITIASQKLGRGRDDFEAAADAILTTDKSRKVLAREIDLDGQPVRIAVMAKGAGMISPNMATLLAVIMTDAKLATDRSQSIIKSVADASFNAVSVDGHTSTNDTLLLLSSGDAAVEIDDSNEAEFVAQMTDAARQVAHQLVADGEGAKRVMRIRVIGANSDSDAEIFARAVGASPLVKTAITGCDPNWGRIVSAAGYAPAKLDPVGTSLTLMGTEIYRGGTPTKHDAAAVSEAMRASTEVQIKLTVGSGPGSATHWASDLTSEYVTFNSEYTT